MPGTGRATPYYEEDTSKIAKKEISDMMNDKSPIVSKEDMAEA